MKTLYTFALSLLTTIGSSQIATDWLGFDTLGEASLHTWHFHNDTVTVMNSNQILYKDAVMYGYDGQDSFLMVYWTPESIHPCKDSGILSEKYHLDFYNDQHLVLFRTITNDCKGLGDIFANHIWVEFGYDIPDGFLNRYGGGDSVGGIDSNDTIGIKVAPDDVFKIYPNPANAAINVHVEQSGEMKIVDMSGRAVLSTVVRKGRNVVDVATLPKGMYVATMGNHRMRLVKQ